MKTREVKLTIPAALKGLLLPQEFVMLLEANGFRFASKSCPIKFEGPHSVTPEEDGSVTYRQTMLADD